MTISPQYSKTTIKKYAQSILDHTFLNSPEVFILPHPLILTLRRFQDFVDIGAIWSNVLLNILKQSHQTHTLQNTLIQPQQCDMAIIYWWFIMQVVRCVVHIFFKSILMQISPNHMKTKELLGKIVPPCPSALTHTQTLKMTTHLLDSQGAVHLLKWLIRPVVEILYMGGGQI